MMLVSEINIEIMKETAALFLLESWAADRPYTIQKDITNSTTVMVKVKILLLIISHFPWPKLVQIMSSGSGAWLMIVSTHYPLLSFKKNLSESLQHLR